MNSGLRDGKYQLQPGDKFQRLEYGTCHYFLFFFFGCFPSKKINQNTRRAAPRRNELPALINEK